MERIVEKEYKVINLEDNSISLITEKSEKRKIVISRTNRLPFNKGEKVIIKDIYNDDYHKVIITSNNDPSKTITIKFKRKKKIVLPKLSNTEEYSVVTSEEVSTRSPLKIYSKKEQEIVNTSSILKMIELFKKLQDTNDTKSWADLEILLDNFGFKNISNQNEYDTQIYLDELTGVVVLAKKRGEEDKATIENISVCGELYASSLPFQGCIKDNNDKTISFYSTINYGIEYSINLLFASCCFIPKW